MCELLVLEDDDLVRVTLAEALRDAGFDVAEARDESEALEILDDGSGCQVLVTDLHLHGSGGAPSGLGVAARAMQCWPEIGVIYMTGRADIMHRKALGPRERALLKPFRPAELIEAVRHLNGVRPAET